MATEADKNDLPVAVAMFPPPPIYFKDFVNTPNARLPPRTPEQRNDPLFTIFSQSYSVLIFFFCF